MAAAQARQNAVALAKSRVKLNNYTQGAKRIYVGGYPKAGDGVKGYSDCSAFVRWVMRKVLGADIGSNTSAQIKNRGRGVMVEMAGSQQVAPTEELLEPGDCVYFKGNPSHTWQVGHVEMYLGDGKCVGHGSGIGPTIKVLKSYCQGRSKPERKYLCVIRWIPDDVVSELGDRLLKLGDAGPDVLALQKLLKAQGYDLGTTGKNKDGCDGEYGSLTKEAVRAFEEAHNLTADGIADVACIGAIQQAAGQPLGRAKVTGNLVNVRSGPGTSHKVLGTVKKGDILELNGGDTETWRGVLYKGKAAYVSGKYLQAER